MTIEDEIRAHWRRIEAWLSANVQPLAKALRPPATAEAIAQAEAALGVAFPSEFIASLAVHDGQDDREFEVFGQWGLLDLANIVDVWRVLSGLQQTGVLNTFDEPRLILTEGAVRPRAWDRAWIPVATKGTGDYLLLDLNPPDTGRRGQIITYGHRSSTRTVVVPDFSAWLGKIADQLASGELRVAGRGSRLASKSRSPR
jgi:cell wall assembly regulator SMI1